MIKLLYLEITDTCKHCPYYENNGHYETGLCLSENRKELHEDLHIPDWCPLPNSH